MIFWWTGIPWNSMKEELHAQVSITVTSWYDWWFAFSDGYGDCWWYKVHNFTRFHYKIQWRYYWGISLDIWSVSDWYSMQLGGQVHSSGSMVTQDEDDEMRSCIHLSTWVILSHLTHLISEGYSKCKVNASDDIRVITIVPVGKTVRLLDIVI